MARLWNHWCGSRHLLSRPWPAQSQPVGQPVGQDIVFLYQQAAVALVLMHAAAPHFACFLTYATHVCFSSLQVLLHQSRQLNESLQLPAAGLSDGGTVTVCSRLRGAGGDGGSTGAESRSCYLEMYAERKPDKVTCSTGSPGLRTVHSWRQYLRSRTAYHMLHAFICHQAGRIPY